MAELTKNIKAKDGISLLVREHIPEFYRAAVCIVHGFGEHSGRYAHVAQFFNDNGFAVMAMDNRGHGQSGGKRGHTPRFDSYMDDIDVFLMDAKQRLNNVPMFLYGHSMGGNLVLNYAIRRQPAYLKGVIATGPWIRLAFEPNPFMITMGKIMRSIFPTFSQGSGLNADHISRDKTVVDAYKNDILVHSKITAAAGMGMTESAAFLNEYMERMPVPTLILHGTDDMLTSQKASEEFANRVSNTTYKKWDGLYHEIHNEPEKQEVFDFALSWMIRFL